MEVRRRSAADAEGGRRARGDEERLPDQRPTSPRGSASATAYTEGRSERDWVEWAMNQLREARYPGLPALAALETSGARSLRRTGARSRRSPSRDFRADPSGHPLPTPSGKIEIFSPALHALGRPAEIPAVPEVHPGVGEPVRPGGAQVPAPGDRPPLARARPFDDERRGLAGGGVSAAPLHQPGRRRRARHPGTATACASSTTAASCRVALPRHAPHHARRGRDPAGRVVVARRRRRRPRAGRSTC